MKKIHKTATSFVVATGPCTRTRTGWNSCVRSREQNDTKFNCCRFCLVSDATCLCLKSCSSKSRPNPICSGITEQLSYLGFSSMSSSQRKFLSIFFTKIMWKIQRTKVVPLAPYRPSRAQVNPFVCARKIFVSAISNLTRSG